MNLIQQELQAREDIKNQIMDMVMEVCQDSYDGYIQRGPLQRYLWEQLGMKGRPSNQFSRFVNRILTNKGYRNSFHVGARCYYGLSWKDNSIPINYPYHKT